VVLLLSLPLLLLAASTRGRTIKIGARSFKDQLSDKPWELLLCRWHRKHADEDFNVSVARKGYWNVWCRCIHCGRVTVWEVRMRDGERTLISGSTVPNYGFEGIGQRTPAERGAIDAKVVSGLAEKFQVAE
jgi:hypothetical protein